jgi:hypothetical protein
MLPPDRPEGQAVAPEWSFEAALGPLLLGVLAHAAPTGGHATWIEAARQHSMRLGRCYAEQGSSAVALALAYRRLLWHTRRLMPPFPEPRTGEQLRWELQVQSAVEDLHFVALVAFERGRRLTVVADRQAAQDQAVQHMAAALRETLVQTITVCHGYTELLAVKQLPDAARHELLGELLTALERLTVEVRRWLRARRYVTARHGAGFLQLDIDRATEPPPH